jgi:hypothetical protein
MSAPMSDSPNPLDGLPDPTMKQVEIEYGILRRFQYKLIRDGEIESYMFAGWRRIVRSSILAYKRRQIEKGPELQPVPFQKRKPGRPKKPRPEQPTAAAE